MILKTPPPPMNNAPSSLMLESEGTCIHSAEEQEEFIDIEIALDSGAGDHVTDDLDAPGYTIQESRGSKNGNHFIDASGNRLENRGQLVLELQTPRIDGSKACNIKSTFQAAKVTRPLWSVGKICDEGHDIRFTKTKAVVCDPKTISISVGSIEKAVCTW